MTRNVRMKCGGGVQKPIRRSVRTNAESRKFSSQYRTQDLNKILQNIMESRPTSPHTSNNNSEGNEEYKQRRIQNRITFREKRKTMAEKRKSAAAKKATNKAANNLTALFSRSQFLLGNKVEKPKRKKTVKPPTRQQPLRQSTRTRVKQTPKCKSPARNKAPSKKESESPLQKYNRLHKTFSTFNNAKKQSLSYNQKCYLENSYNKFKTKRVNKPSYATMNNANMAGPSCAQRYSSMSE